MKRMGTGIGLLMCLPQLWLAMLGVLVAVLGSHWEPLVDIVTYAIRRLAQ
jgi:hypothetical protein